MNSSFYESMTTIFWPCDVFCNGYFYGWVKHHTLCVAAALDTNTRPEAEAIVADAIRSNDCSILLASCGTPVVLGYATFSPFRPSSIPNFRDCDASIKSPIQFIFYYRHSRCSLRFYVAEVDASSLPCALEGANSTVDVSLAHDFTQRRGAKYGFPEHIMVEMWNVSRLLEDAVESCRARSYKHMPINNRKNNVKRPLHHPPPGTLTDFTWISDSLSRLRKYSFTVRQIEGRVTMLYQLIQRGPLRSNAHVALLSFAYNRHYNSVWIILNDLIIGLVFRQFLCQNRDALNIMVADGLERTLAARIQKVLLWLDSWPAGLKLNTELSRFYSHGFIGLITGWTKLLHYSLSLLPAISFVVETTSLLGMTMTVSLSLDLISILTAHLHVCYFISSTIHRHVLLLIGSLWNLFRGKRYNILRNRTDSWDYDIDQLLLGTILFTLTAHLFPTIVVYYTLFALLRLGIIVSYASGETLLAFMNHFPLFALMLRAKDPQRLPGDTYLRVNHNSPDYTVTVESHPLPFVVVFAQYAGLWRQLARHYHPVRLGQRLLLGQMLDTFPEAHINPPLHH